MYRLVGYIAHKHKQDTGLISLPNLPSTPSGKPPMKPSYGPPYSPIPAPSILSHVFLIVTLTSRLSHRSTFTIGRTPTSTFPCQITLNSPATDMDSLRYPGALSMISITYSPPQLAPLRRSVSPPKPMSLASRSTLSGGQSTHGSIRG